MSFSEAPLIQSSAMAINTGGTVTAEFYFPRAARIKRYFAVPAVAQAAHSTVVVDVTFTDAGNDGAGTGSDVLALLTNDSDDADDTITEVGAWVANVPKEVNCESRPAGGTTANNVADEIAAGTTIKAAIRGAGSTPTANQLTVGVEYVWST